MSDTPSPPPPLPPPAAPPLPITPPPIVRAPVPERAAAKTTKAQIAVIIAVTLVFIVSPFTLNIVYGTGIADAEKFTEGVSKFVCWGCAIAGFAALIGGATRRWSYWPAVVVYAVPMLLSAVFIATFLVSTHRRVISNKTFDKLDQDKAQLADGAIKQIDESGSITDNGELMKGLLGSLDTATKQLSGDEAAAMGVARDVLAQLGERSAAYSAATKAFTDKGGLDPATLGTPSLLRERLAMLDEIEARRSDVLSKARTIVADAEAMMKARNVSPHFANAVTSSLRKDLESNEVFKIHKLLSEQFAAAKVMLGVLDAYPPPDGWSVRDDGVIFSVRVPSEATSRFDASATRVNEIQTEVGDLQRAMFERLKNKSK